MAFGTQLAESIIAGQFDKTADTVNQVMSATVEKMRDDNISHKREIGKDMFKDMEDAKGNQRMLDFYDSLLKQLEKRAQ